MKLSCLLILVLFFSVSHSQTKIFDDSITSITEISTNSIHSDFGPSVIHDTLYFTSFNEKKGKTGKKEFYDLFVSVIDKKGEEKKQRQAVKEFITRYNDGTVSWCEKTGELYVTQNYIDHSVKKKPYAEEIIRLKIIIARQVNGKWIKTGEFPYHNPGYSVGHPAITESGDTLIFSSDMPGGYGQTDLYYSVRKEGKWETPVNMGSIINTTEKEGFAFLTERNFNGRFLIFSSTRNKGIGGLDLYYTKFPAFSEIGHFNKPINTEYDDFALTIPAGADFGYLTSNRPGTGDDDIYKFTFKRIKEPEVTPKFRELYVYDKTSGKPIPGVRIISCDKNSYQTDARGKISAVIATDEDCEIIVSAAGYKDKSEKSADFNFRGSLKDTIWMDVLKKTELRLSNIYYDLDKWDILPESAVELDNLAAILKENPDYKVVLRSYTDDRGSIEYNLGLSWMRTRAAMNYIISKGIDRSRISGENYGEMQLVNNCPESCTPEQYRENRRTEIVIPGILNGNPVRQVKGDYYDQQISALKNNNPGKEEPLKSFFLVFKSFQDEKETIKFIDVLKKAGVKFNISRDSVNTRIGIVYHSFTKARNARESFKDEYPGCWILPIN